MLFSLLIAFLAFTVGMAGIGITMVLMGIGSAPGAMIHDWGRNTENIVVRVGGFALCALGQAFVVGIYIALVIGSVYWFSENYSDSPIWPLWMAAFFHSLAVPVYAMKERPSQRTAQHDSLGIVASIALILFFAISNFPKTFSALYWWVPLYNHILQ